MQVKYTYIIIPAGILYKKKQLLLYSIMPIVHSGIIFFVLFVAIILPGLIILPGIIIIC